MLCSPAKSFVLDGDTNEIVAEVDFTPISQSVVSSLMVIGKHLRSA